jgi:DNA modification methylase
MMGDQAAACILDPPYNCKIRSIVGRGRTRHREFAMASGEMNPAEFIQFLSAALTAAAGATRSGGLIYCFMDWRGLPALMVAADGSCLEMMNMIIWVKTNAGQGSFYRSQHEVVGLFRVGAGNIQNNIELGRHGRSRSNVWSYGGVNSFRAGRMDELRSHPTCKPVALVADALRDCTQRGDVVLDTFLGSGTTLMAAERVGRIAHGVEIDPGYVDVAVRRWQAFTGRDAIHAKTKHVFNEVHAPTMKPASSKGPRR